MRRRSFFKNLAIFPLACLGENKKDDEKNILENATIQILLPFSLDILQNSFVFHSKTTVKVD